MAKPLFTNRGRLLVACPDRPGIIAAISDALFRLGANIVASDQYSEDPAHGMFFMRTEFELADYQQQRGRVEAALVPVAERFQMQWRLATAGERKRLGIFVSREGHCLQELLWQCQTGEIPAEVAVVISNHPDLKAAVAPFGIPFQVIPVTAETKVEAEQKAQAILAEARVDAVVLARYMQILTPAMVAAWKNRIINIHHSFLPAFVGPNPYQQAYARGVKLIGATAHYVTEELDAGPIIEQDVQRVDHRHRVEDLRRLGRHVERMVLARAVRWHVEDRVWVHQNRTVVFP
jgi:formyltetrahydrofolate deformylase